MSSSFSTHNDYSERNTFTGDEGGRHYVSVFFAEYMTSGLIVYFRPSSSLEPSCMMSCWNTRTLPANIDRENVN
ncbi:hypothetical protein DPMN_112056 [Dreissena polymorpha]|uniref:Uncharacterized protein n=1 Tax=Dreissena polymorpha TaxID=45954 RepID=A0A9D4KG37_DREPO|nr:hypothetical protein DPMN_112056 [Dreissena polymorpha]